MWHMRAGLTDLTIAHRDGRRCRDDWCRTGAYRSIELDEPFLAGSVVSANAYLGAEPILEALQRGADVVITGRVADPSLFVAPILAAFGWALDDWPRVGLATLVGHLLECAGQVTGGYFADPGVKDVPHLERLGFPLAEITPDGDVVVTKVPGSGGLVTTATCTEQLLYEVHDPAAYVTPDVVADFSRVTMEADGADRVRVCWRDRTSAARHAEGLGRPGRRVDWRRADLLRGAWCGRPRTSRRRGRRQATGAWWASHRPTFATT